MLGSQLGRGAWVARAVFVGLFALAAPAGAQDFGLVTTLEHPNQRPNDEDRFGSGLAISGGTLFVGAKDERAANDYSGVVHVFSDVGWSEVARLESSLATDIEFGAAIQLDGERALISNTALDNGVVWFFEKVRGLWQEVLRVQGLTDEAFGYRLALRGDFAFIAVPRIGTGNVRVYQHVAGTWREVQVLTASDAQAEDYFGYSMAFDGQRLVVAAPGSNLGPKRSGVYTFSKVGDAFVEDGKIVGSDPVNQWFGADVGVSGDTLIVNAPPAYQGMIAGKALVYERRGEQWALDRELTVNGESFPGGLSMDQDIAWLGASTNEPRAQSVFAFQRSSDGWREAQKLNFAGLGQYEITRWTFRDGTLAVGSWNGLRTESVRVYRGPGHESSSSAGAAGGGASGQAGGTAGVGNASATGVSGEGTGVSTKPADSGGGASDPDGSAGRAAQSQSSEGGGCELAPSKEAQRWPLIALALALALRCKRRGQRTAIACG